MQPTQLHDVPPSDAGFSVSVPTRPTWLVLVVAVVAGLVVGCFDRALQDTLPYPFANLANSGAVWAIAAFAIGLWVAHRAWLAALAGIVTLSVAVAAYYGASSMFTGDSLQWLSSRPTQLWLGFALIVGALFGAAGTWARHGDNAIRAVGLAFAPSVLFAEALNLARLAIEQDTYDTRPGATAVIELGCGLVVLGALALFVARDRFDWLRAAAACIPITLIGFGLYTVTGYGG